MTFAETIINDTFYSCTKGCLFTVTLYIRQIDELGLVGPYNLELSENMNREKLYVLQRMPDL